MCVSINVIMTFLDFISKHKLVLIEKMVIIDYQRLTVHVSFGQRYLGLTEN